MDKSAILHIPMSQYAYGVDETHVTIRLRAKKDDIGSCTLFFGDRACRQTPVIFSKQEMEKVYSTSLYDYFEVTLENPYKRLCYYFDLKSGDAQIYYYGDCFCKGLGINAIYINPIFAAGEYHKYDLVDYYHVDPCFGSNEEFKQLVDTFHENGLKVIIDGVFNHCGWKFFAFEDVVQKGKDAMI